MPQPGEFLVEDGNHNVEDSWGSELPACKSCNGEKKEGLVEKVQLGFGYGLELLGARVGTAGTDDKHDP